MKDDDDEVESHNTEGNVQNSSRKLISHVELFVALSLSLSLVVCLLFLNKRSDVF